MFQMEGDQRDMMTESNMWLQTGFFAIKKKIRISVKLQ